MKKIMFYCHVFYPQNTGYSNAFQNLINSILANDDSAEITVMTPYPLDEGVAELQSERLKVIRLKPIVNFRIIRYFLNDYLFAPKFFQKGKS